MRPAFFPLPELVVNLLFGEERAKVMTQGQKVEPKRVLEYNFEYKHPKIETACKEVSKLFYNTPFWLNWLGIVIHNNIIAIYL